MLKTIAKEYSHSIKVHRSEFIAFLYPVKESEQVKEILSAHNEKFKDATHNCYAFVLGKNQETQYYSDQGEPSGTAGKPILNSLLKYNLTFVLSVVTRYYGGIKLGVRGLIDAYSDAVEQVIQNSQLKDFIAFERLTISSDYSALETLKHLLKQFDAVINPLDFSDYVSVELLIPEDNLSDVHKILDDFIRKEQICIIDDSKDLTSRQEE